MSEEAEAERYYQNIGQYYPEVNLGGQPDDDDDLRAIANEFGFGGPNTDTTNVPEADKR